MNNLPLDTELEAELQELYVLCKHWLQDISFLEDETHIFKNILEKYHQTGQQFELSSKNADVCNKIQEQEERLAILKTKIPEFLSFLEPFISNLKKEMDMAFLGKYNTLEASLRDLFAEVKATKNELFNYAEQIEIKEKAGN
jgi:hypothetical protein